MSFGFQVTGPWLKMTVCFLQRNTKEELLLWNNGILLRKGSCLEDIS
jgi:hypothetical protein